MRALARGLLAVLMMASGLAQGQTIVQPNGNSSVSQLGAESPLGQSFVATVTGSVVAFGVRSMNTVTATLRIYQGSTGSGTPNVIGSPLYTQPGVSLTAAGGTGSAFGFSNIPLATPF